MVAETLERMDRSQTFSTANDAVESARETDAAARRMADEVVTGLFAA